MSRLSAVIHRAQRAGNQATATPTHARRPRLGSVGDVLVGLVALPGSVPFVDGLEAELRAASDALRRLDARRQGQMQYRDDLVRRAIASGVTWARVQDATGLTVRGVQQALRRG